MANEYVGSHIAIDTTLEDPIINSIKIIQKAGGNIVQIFLTNACGLDIEHFSKDNLDKCKKYLEKYNMKIVVHGTYKLNIAREWDSYSWQTAYILTEIKNCHRIGSLGLVIHLGKSMNINKKVAYNNMYSFIIHIIKKTKQYNHVKIILETSSGQGSELCYKLEDLAYFYKKFSDNTDKEIRDRVKICIDTCHIFAAGYDITTIDKSKKYLSKFDQLIGLNNVILIQLNDSYGELGSKIDRHADIGTGKIGKTSLLYFSNFFKKRGVPIVLETPETNYGNKISMLK